MASGPFGGHDVVLEAVFGSSDGACHVALLPPRRGAHGHRGVPLIYAAAMATEAVAALVTGFAYDRWGAVVLYTLPVTVVAVPALTLANTLTVVMAGVLLWGAVTGVQDSTVKALVAELVPQRRRATAYGVFAAFQGVAALAGGVLAGGLYTEQRTLLIALVVFMQLCSVVLLAVALHGTAKTHPSDERVHVHDRCRCLACGP
jgi:MFS family permease